MHTEFSYINPFSLKWCSSEGANHLKSFRFAVIYSSKFGEDWSSLKEDFANNEIRSFPYLLDMAATVKGTRA